MLESKSGTIGPTKNGRSRTVTVPPVARDAIADLPVNASGLLFESSRGQMWRQPSHHHCWKVVRAMAGRPGLDFYELRHCAATMLLERGMTPWDVAIQLGHQDGGRLVTSLYGHPSEVAARERLLACWETPAAEITAIRSGAPVVTAPAERACAVPMMGSSRCPVTRPGDQPNLGISPL